MQLKKLELANVRAFNQAEFKFQPGMNLLVGINGAGKSTVLDVLRVMLSKSLPWFTTSKSKPSEFSQDDIKIGEDWLYVRLAFEIADGQLEEEYEVREWQKTQNRITNDDRRDLDKLKPTTTALAKFKKNDEITKYLEYRQEVLKHLPSADEQAIAVYFYPHRSYPVERKPSQQASAGGQAAAFANALTNRELNIREFAEWMLVQEVLAAELGPKTTHRLEILNRAVFSFLDGVTNLRAVREPKPTLLVDKNGATLDIRQLSDGERNMIALVLDLARRLTQANPKLDDPLQDGKAVVLIDELDLHLHPRWQRTICDRLTTTFPNCQFIATTHSPQIVGEVAPDSITLIEQGVTFRPRQSLGMDSSWVLEYLMGTTDRNPDVDEKLDEIGDLIEDEKFEQAAKEIDKLRNEIGEFPQLVMLQARLDRFRLLGL